MVSNEDLGKLVRPDEGLVARNIFVDRAIYELELDRIFARSWLYIGHTSQLKEPESFFTTTMGEDPVLVTRGNDGSIRAFLNSCTHRGTLLCNASSGTAERFRCPYHGWTFAGDGSLCVVPRSKEVYHGELDRSAWGLREVAQLDQIGGLLFATWDPTAPSLGTYLGDMTFYLDLMLNRLEGGIEVVGGMHQWTVDTNWKFAADNFSGDYYHLPFTHLSSMETGLRSPLSNQGHTISVGNGHGVASETGGVMRGTAAKTAYTDFVASTRQRITHERGKEANEVIPVGVGTVFPNLAFMDTMRFRTIRTWQPRGPHQTEIFSFCFVDAALPEELKEETRRQYSLSFGPSGLFEQDDGEIWARVQAGLQGFIGRQGDLNYTMGRGRERPVADRLGPGLPGTMGDTLITEANQRAFYRQWLASMTEQSSWEMADIPMGASE